MNVKGRETSWVGTIFVALLVILVVTGVLVSTTFLLGGVFVWWKVGVQAVSIVLAILVVDRVLFE